VRVYVDGVETRALTASGALQASTGPLIIGGRSAYSFQRQCWPGQLDEVAVYDCALSSNQVADLYNLRPVLSAQTNLAINEMTTIVVTNTASDPGLPFNVLRYTLLAAPTNATIGTNTGVITWTPTEAQGPGTGVFTTVVTDNGVPPLSATNSFTVTVREVNRAPSISMPTNRTINELTQLTVTNTATDPDIPANALRFALVSGPTGAVVNATNGVLTWTPSEGQGPTTVVLTVSVTDDGVPPLSATGRFAVVVNEMNVAPVFNGTPTNRAIDELTLLTVTNAATDPDIPSNTLTYALIAAPTNAAIGTNTGVITWTPTEAQGPGTGVFTTAVTDNGAPALSSTNSFAVVVNEVNVAPMLAVPSNVTIHAKALLSLTATATDVDLPSNTLTFSLVSGPDALLVTPDGRIIWTPSDAQAGTTNRVWVQVADNGTPNLSATNSFVVTVQSRPALLSVLPAGSNVSLSWTSITGDRYRVQHRTALDSGAWTNMGGAVAATGNTASETDTPPVGAGQRFYRITVVP